VNAKNINLQDVFLNQARKEHVGVTIYLTNGFQLRGIVRGYDNFTVLLDSEGKQQMVYKHAISTITPSRPLQLQPEILAAIEADGTERPAEKPKE
jgi:host factor-I protein